MFNVKNLSKKAIGFGVLYVIIKWSIIILVGGYIYKAGLWRNEYFFFVPIVVLLGLALFFWKKRKASTNSDSK